MKPVVMLCLASGLTKGQWMEHNLILRRLTYSARFFLDKLKAVNIKNFITQ